MQLWKVSLLLKGNREEIGEILLLMTMMMMMQVLSDRKINRVPTFVHSHMCTRAAG